MKPILTAILSLLFITSFAQQSLSFKSDHKKNYATDCKPCKDSWVGEVFYKTWGTCPATLSEVIDGYCNIKVWNNGSWNDRAHLERIILNKFTKSVSSGKAYSFIKPQNVAGLGHIGWGFQLSDGSFYAGSTENYVKGIIRTYIILAGQDNDFWGEMFLSESAMFAKFKQLGYDRFKSVNVSNPNIAFAKRRAEETKMNGFQGISNNCLDQTYHVLEGYGVKDMPWKQTNPTPNGWFNAFKHNDFRWL